MGILDRLMRRKTDHETWLANHPGKGRITMDAPGISASEEAATRDRMERELSEQRNQRESQ